MDDLYDDLENYNDVNALEELRNENRKLKLRNDECTAEIKRLQKKLDHVSSEHKILLNNYSSLLITARAEIERKSQIITNLNAEKDMLVLKSIQNSNKSLAILRRNMARERSNNRKMKKDDLDTWKPNKSDLKKLDPERIGNEENRIPTPDTVSNGHTDDSNKVINSENNFGKESYDKTGDSNIPKGKKALSLKQRRKSMPVLCKQATFSSDEEYEANCSDNTNKRERPSREDKSRKHFDRHKLIHKISETSGIDEKYSSCHESSRETFKMNRFNDKYRIPRDKSRNRKHFSPEKSRRVTRDQDDNREDVIRHNRVLVSPPRENFDSVRQYRDRRSNYDRDEGRRSRRDYFKGDRYNQREGQESRHSQDENDGFSEKMHKHRYGFREERSKNRSVSHEDRFRPTDNYEVEKQGHKGAFEKEMLEHRDAFQEDRNRQRYDSQEESYSQKEPVQEERHNVLNERVDTYDVKPNKRKNSVNEQSRSQLDVQQEKKRKHRSKSREDPNRQVKPTTDKATSDCDEPSSKRARIDSAIKPAEEISKPKESPIVEDKILPVFAKHMQHNSCQSPDNPPLDTQPATVSSTQPKEIMNTAATYLEDPRITSKKYRKEIEGNKVVIMTATGRNVDLVPIDISTWNIPRVDVPPALQNTDQFTNEMVHDIYADVDNTNSNMSMLSVDTESNDVRMANYMSRNFNLDYENERINQIEATADKKIENVQNKRDSTNETVEQKDNVGNKESILNQDERKLPPVRYKISRVSNVEAKKDTAPNPLGVLLQQFQTVCGVDIITKPHAPKLNVDETFGADDDSPDRTAKAKEDNQRDSRHLRRRKMSAKELVEGDLALSDETMDNVMVQKQTNEEKRVKEQSSSKIESQTNVTEAEKQTAKPVKKSTLRKTKKSKNDKVSNRKKEEGTTEDCTEKHPDATTNKKTRKKKEEGTTEDCTEKRPDAKTNKKTRKKPVTKQTAPSTNEAKNSIDVEKKTKGKKSTSPKRKFPELFGDSSSLITPEDLGMVTETQTEKSNKYVPIFEDAQDAVDVNVSAMKKKELVIPQPPVSSSKTNESASKENPKSIICKISLPLPAVNKNAENDSTQLSIPKPLPRTSKNDNNATVSVPTENNRSDPVSRKSIVAISKGQNIDTSLIRKETLHTSEQENTDTTSVLVKKITPNMEVSNAVVTKEPETVTTVIISTGVQPEIEEPQTSKLADKIETIAQTSATKITEAIPMALATSTPHKRLLLQLETEIESNRSCTSSEPKKDDSSRGDRSSMSNGMSIEAQNDDDVPDVRIFVRRRRRLKK